MSNEKLIDVYRAMLDTAGLYVDEDGYVSYRVSKDKLRPYLVKGKRLVIPTRHHLTNEVDETIRFHPLSENILKGESDVMEKYRTALLVRLNSLSWHILEQLVRIAGSQKEMNQLNPAQSEFLAVLKDVDEKTLEHLLAIRDHYVSKHSLSRSVISLYIKRDAKLNDRAYFRAGITTFPFYKELTEQNEKVVNVKLRVKDRKQLTALMENIFPQLKDNPDWYCRGSNSKVAPTIDALLNTVAAIASSLNAVCELFQKQIDDSITTDGWEDQLTELDSFERYVRLVPPQPGNEGRDDKTEKPLGTDISTIQKAEKVVTATAAPSAPMTNLTVPLPTASTIPVPPVPLAPSLPPEPKPAGRLSQLMASRDVAHQSSMPAPQQQVYVQPVVQQQPVDTRLPWKRGATVQPQSMGYAMPVSNGLVPVGGQAPTNNYLSGMNQPNVGGYNYGNNYGGVQLP